MNEYGQNIAPEQKKNIWDYLDAVVGVYSSIRTQGQTPNQTQTQVGGLDVAPKLCDEGFVSKDGKCVKEEKSNLLLIGLGVALLGTATYFAVKKMRS